MGRLFLITLLVVVVLVVALFGWAVEGLRWAFTGARKPQPRPASLATSIR
jgi:hypothetical protein